MRISLEDFSTMTFPSMNGFTIYISDFVAVLFSCLDLICAVRVVFDGKLVSCSSRSHNLISLIS